ncbi:hypothetical protein G9A89_013320 [Geosiphon pyriformis]|nr:hypothetical protein G9A89_013320 [Geosiphon pyriformis]
MDLEAAFTPKNAFHGPAGGFFSQKKRVVLGNVKHLGDEKDISLNRSELGNNMFSNVNSVSGDEKGTDMTGINVESLLDSAANTPKAKRVNTSAIFSSPLSSPNFVMDDNEKISFPPHLSISLKKKWIDPKIVKTQIKMFVKKFFALNINLSAVKGNSTTAKTQLIRKIFSSVNGFGGATTPSKFERIIQSTFTSEKSMNMVAFLAREREIIINTNFKKSGVHSDQAVVIKEIPMNTPREMIVTTKTMVEFAELSQANLLASRWLFLIGKNSVRVAKAVGDRDIWASRNHFKALLFTLPVGTTAHDLGIFLDRTGNLDLAFCTEPVLGSVQLSWTRLDLVQCGKCGHFGHSALECDAPVGSMSLSSSVKSFKGFVSEERRLQLAKLYKKKKVPIFCPVAFGRKSWAQVVSVASPLSHGFPAGPSSNLLLSSYHDIGDSFSLNECLASLECSLELLSDQVSTIVRCLDSAELVPLVSFSFVSPPDTSVSLASGSGSDMVLDDTSILSASFSSTVDVGVHVLSSNSSRILTGKVGGLKSKLAFLEASIGSVLACLNSMCSSLGASLHSFSK